MVIAMEHKITLYPCTEAPSSTGSRRADSHVAHTALAYVAYDMHYQPLQSSFRQVANVPTTIPFLQTPLELSLHFIRSVAKLSQKYESYSQWMRCYGKERKIITIL